MWAGRPRRTTTAMADLAFILIIVAFFALAAVIVRACDRIIGSDEAAASASESIDERPAGRVGAHLAKVYAGT